MRPTETTSIEMVFNERTGSWSKRSQGFEAYAELTYIDGNSVRLGRSVFGAVRGYLVELNVEESDGGQVYGSSTYTLTGTVTSSEDQTLSDTGATFPTTPDTMRGLKLTVVSKADDSEQERDVYFNEATKLWLDTAWDTNPTAGDTYHLAGIPAHWESPAWAVGGQLGIEYRLHALKAWFAQDGNNTDVDFTIEQDGDSEQQDTGTLVSGTRKNEVTISASGMETTVRFENNKPDEPFEIEAFALLVDQASDQIGASD